MIFAGEKGKVAPTMARVCEITGKRPLVGHKVSHSNRKTKKRQLPNLRSKRIFDEATGRWMRIRTTTAGLRTITNNGLSKALKDAR